MADEQILRQIDEALGKLPNEMITAAGGVIVTQQHYTDEAVRDALNEAFLLVERTLREVAELWTRSKKRGWQTTSTEHLAAARIVAGISRSVREWTEAVPGAPTAAESRGGPSIPAEWCGNDSGHGPHTWRMTVEVPDAGDFVETVPGPMRHCSGHVERDLSGLDRLIAERAGAAPVTISTVSTATDVAGLGSAVRAAAAADVAQLQRAAVDSTTAYLTGAAHDIPGSRPLGPGSVPPAAPDAIEQAFTPHRNSPCGVEPILPAGDLFDDPAPIGWTNATTNAEGYRVPGAPAPPAVFDDPAPRRGSWGGTRLSWGDVRDLIGKDRRGAGLPEHLSHSQVDTLGDCGLKYVMQRDEQLGVIEVPQWSLIGGNAFHAAVEWFERLVAEVRQLQHVKDRLQVFAAEQGDLQAPRGEVLWRHFFAAQIAEVGAGSPVPQDEWRASNKGMEGYTWWLINGGDMVQRYVEHRHVEISGSGWRSIRQHLTGEAGQVSPQPMIEHEFRLTVEGVPFVGFIDQVWTIEQQHGEMRPGDILIDDCKSGARVGGNTRQLGEYAQWLLQHERELASPLALSLATGTVRIWGRFYDARKGTWSEPVDLLARHPWDEIVVEVLDADAKKAGGLFSPHRTNFCGGCSVKHACPIFSTLSS